MTRVERSMTLMKAYAGPLYGDPVIHTETHEVGFLFPNVSAALSSDPLRPPDLQEKSELGLSGSAYIGYEDFPALLSAVRTTHWPVVVRNKQCQMPMVGDDYHGPTCTGTLIAATSQDNCHMPTVVGGEDYSGPICTPPSGNQTTIILVACRRVTITSCYASKLVWRPAAKFPLPGNSVSN